MWRPDTVTTPSVAHGLGGEQGGSMDELTDGSRGLRARLTIYPEQRSYIELLAREAGVTPQAMLDRLLEKGFDEWHAALNRGEKPRGPKW